MTPDGGIFPVMQDNAGLNLEACVLQQGMLRASSASPATTVDPFAAARGLSRAIAHAVSGRDDAISDPFEVQL